MESELNSKRIKQVAKIANVSEEVVKAVFAAELLRASRELMISDRKWFVGIYGEVFPKSPEDFDVGEIKVGEEFYNLITGKIDENLMESI